MTMLAFANFVTGSNHTSLQTTISSYSINRLLSIGSFGVFSLI